MKRFIPSLAILFLITASQAATLDQTLDAIRTQESGGKDLVGDAGAAVGPYQLHKGYWSDSRVKGKYEDCHNEAYSRQVVIAYMKRYCPEAIADPSNVDAEKMARIHNGGPTGATNSKTLKYWKAVKAILER